MLVFAYNSNPMMRIVEETFIHNKKTINDPIEPYSLLKELKLSIKKLKPRETSIIPIVATDAPEEMIFHFFLSMKATL